MSFPNQSFNKNNIVIKMIGGDEIVNLLWGKKEEKLEVS